MTPEECQLWTCRVVRKQMEGMILAQPTADVRGRWLALLGYREIRQTEHILSIIVREQKGGRRGKSRRFDYR